MAQRLANELLDAANGTGASVKRREDLLRTFGLGPSEAAEICGRPLPDLPQLPDLPVSPV